MSFPKYDSNRPIVAIDSETSLFKSGRMAPLATCWAFAWRDARGSIETDLLSHREGAREVMGLLEQAVAGKITLALQNGPYDFAVLAAEYPEALPLIFDAHEAGAIHDTMFAEQIVDIARGLLRMEFDEEAGEYKSKKSYGLENLARIHLWWPPYKDEWRMRYAELRDVAIKDYPEAASIYPKKDAEATLRITEIQRDIAAGIAPHDPLVAVLAHVCRTYTALHFVACWGHEVDADDAIILEQCIREYGGAFVPDLISAGLVHRVAKGKKAGSLTKKKAPLQALIVNDWLNRFAIDVDTADVLTDPATWLPPEMLTDGGRSGVPQVKYASDVLVDCIDPRLKKMAAYLESEKLRSSFGTPLLQFAGRTLHSRYGLAETGRTTCSGGSKRSRMGFNVQQLPAKMPKKLVALMMEKLGREIDIRSCFVPRPGWVYSSSDFAALEMCTFAQACKWLVGYSTLGDALNNGVDPHTLFASDLLSATYEDTLALVKAKDPDAIAARKRAKVGGFGFMGGMGAKKFVMYAKKQDVALELEESQRLHALYRQRWPETKAYFEMASQAVNGGETTMVGLVSDMVRGGVGYSDWCNGNFQEPAAYGATSGVWKIVRECYDERLATPLLGSRMTAFIHDEFQAEHPADRAHEAATRLADVARETMQECVPDVTIRIEPALMRKWWKRAETVRDEQGRLVPWEPT